jgi:hypothetical protein
MWFSALDFYHPNLSGLRSFMKKFKDNSSLSISHTHIWTHTAKCNILQSTTNSHGASRLHTGNGFNAWLRCIRFRVLTPKHVFKLTLSSGTNTCLVVCTQLPCQAPWHWHWHSCRQCCMVTAGLPSEWPGSSVSLYRHSPRSEYIHTFCHWTFL